ncbi:hypothetical protein WS91_12355 [Burkholderia sp. MSMB1498]|nr:hypothetical protein WS91_12355 [Burkholderia sp. MSMB1498]
MSGKPSHASGGRAAGTVARFVAIAPRVPALSGNTRRAARSPRAAVAMPAHGGKTQFGISR